MKKVHNPKRAGYKSDVFFKETTRVYPPPSTELLKQFWKFVVSKDDLVLDFFGGSGTTAQAMMELDKAEGGGQQFILVQQPEFVDGASPRFKAGFCWTTPSLRALSSKTAVFLAKNQ